jgi:cyanophycinase
MQYKLIIFLILPILSFSCKTDLGISAKAIGSKANNTVQKAAPTPTGLVTYLTGDGAEIIKTTQPGLLLMGGSTDVDPAIAWFLSRANGGDVVVIRASGADGYNTYMYNMVAVNSVETIIIDSRAKANLPEVEQKIRNAEALFIAGGDQWDYVNYWKDSPVENAINYLANSKGVTIGGTSAGLAILGNAYFSAQNGSVTSAQALANPYVKTVTLGSNDFISAPFMQNIITDSHYSQRDRQGRHITFMARLMKDFGYTTIKGIGIDEQTALCVDGSGIGMVYGVNSVYFLQNNAGPPETCLAKKALTWNLNNQAVKAIKITGSLSGNGSANLVNWTFTGASSFYYFVNNGVLRVL